MDTKSSNVCAQNPPNTPYLISEHLSLDQPVVGIQLLQCVLSNIQHIYLHCLKDIGININCLEVEDGRWNFFFNLGWTVLRIRLLEKNVFRSEIYQNKKSVHRGILELKIVGIFFLIFFSFLFLSNNKKGVLPLLFKLPGEIGNIWGIQPGQAGLRRRIW